MRPLPRRMKEMFGDTKDCSCPETIFTFVGDRQANKRVRHQSFERGTERAEQPGGSKPRRSYLTHNFHISISLENLRPRRVATNWRCAPWSTDRIGSSQPGTSAQLTGPCGAC